MAEDELLAAAEAVLGGAMRDRRALELLASGPLTPEDMPDGLNRAIFGVLLRNLRSGRPTDAAGVHAALQTDPQWSGIAAGRLHLMVEHAPTVDNVRRHVDVIADEKHRRALLQAVEEYAALLRREGEVTEGEIRQAQARVNSLEVSTAAHVLPPRADIGRFIETPAPPIKGYCGPLAMGRAAGLSAAGGTGKTTVLTQLALAGATGEAQFGWPVEATGSVILVLAEDTEADVHRRIARMAQGLTPAQRELATRRMFIYAAAGMRLRLLVRDGPMLQVGELYHALREVIASCPEAPVFIALDSAVAISEGDELDQGHQRQLAYICDRIAIESGACVLLVTHAAKRTAGDDELGSHTARGAGALTDGLRAELAMRGMTQTEGRKFGIHKVEDRRRWVQLALTKANYAPPEAFQPLWLRRGPGGLLVADEPGPTDALAAAGVVDGDMKVLQVLVELAEKGEPKTQDWLQASIDRGLLDGRGKPDAVMKRLERIRQRLAAAGLVMKGAGHGVWVPV